MRKQGNGILTSEKPILGFHPVDLLGILVMVIPFVISVNGEWEILNRILFIHWTEKVKITPYAISTLLAVIFYAGIVVRFDIFKANNIAQALISSVRTFLDCWVLAALLSFVIPTTKNTSLSFKLIQQPQIMLLFFAVALTWLGMKTVAGYSWILFILTAWSHANKTSGAMGLDGAVFMLTIAISLFLQIRDLTKAKDFLNDFKEDTRGFADQVRGNMNSAVSDATKKVYTVSNYVRRGFPGNVPVFTRTPAADAGTTKSIEPGKGIRINLEALDVNGDGVVDEKDIELLRKK